MVSSSAHLGWVLGLALGCSGPGESLPAVVALITIDTWRADHFDATHTPRLWELAEAGERYTNAWSPMGLTTPAHATIPPVPSRPRTTPPISKGTPFTPTPRIPRIP